MKKKGIRTTIIALMTILMLGISPIFGNGIAYAEETGNQCCDIGIVVWLVLLSTAMIGMICAIIRSQKKMND